MQTFEQWWNEIENFSLRAERFTTPGEAAKAAWDQAMSLRAQADARPVAWIDGKTLAAFDNPQNGWKNTVCGLRRADEVLDSDVPLYTHPEASAGLRVFFDKEELDALYEAIEWAKDEGLPGTAEHLQAIFDAHDPETSAPGLVDAPRYAEWRHLVDQGQWSDGVPAWARDHEGRMNDVTAMRAVIEELSTLLTRASAATVAEPSDPAHPDDEAVGRFAVAMKQKLAQAREKGRGGWQECDPVELSIMLREHVEKGDPRDVANFCMFLWNLGKPISDAALPYGKRAAQQQADPGADERAVATPFLTTQVEGDPDPAKQRFRMVAEYRSLEDMYQGHDLFVAAVKAAQSGQRAGVAEDARDAARWRAVEPYLGIADVGDEDFIYGLTVEADRLEIDSNRLILWKNLAEASVGAAIDAIAAAAPTQQQEGA